MKSNRYILLFSLVILLTFHACNDDITDKVVREPELITPDFTEKITTSVKGFVVDEDGNPVAYASVAAGEKQISTDEYGYFELSNASLPKFAGQVKVTKTGYFDAYKTFIPQDDDENFVRLKLLTKTNTGTIDAAVGGTATTVDGVTVTLPANGVVTASNNAAYTGAVQVSVRSINPSEDNTFQLERPGDSRATDENGHAKTLKSFSTIAVDLTGNSGQKLQIMEGKSATINLPIPSAVAADAPSTIALWSFNTTTGLWKQEGSATKTGNFYVGSVSHFSFWDSAEGLSLVNFSARIVDASSQPLVNVPVSVTIAGLPKNAGHGRFGYTDANGFITGAVFANKDLVLDILTPCALSAYSHEFSTAAVDVDLGTLTGNLGQNAVTLSGSVVDCENQPVANGFIQTYDNGFYNRIEVTNGTFNFTGIACTNTTVNIVAVDNATYEQNIPKSVTIIAGANNLGVLTACGTSTMGFISYTLDDVTTVDIMEPTDTIAAYNLAPSANTQILTLSGDPNQGQKMSIQFNGGTAIGSGHKFSDIFSTAFPSGRGYWPAEVTLTITEYGKVGGFISGEFSGNFLDFEDNSLHTMSCSFRVRRKH